MSELLVLDHVHWDREWYRPHEEFRSRLVDLVQTVVDELEGGRREFFHLDGQTITLADVLEVRPDLEPRLKALVQSGRLSVGPWHVLADNQLVSGECLVRNLLIGRRWSERIGGGARDGYSPDAFGHPADLPRVLRGFGIDTALVWRGAPPEHARFRWRSLDGSEVLAINQRYHEVEVLWGDATATEALAGFVEQERQRHPQGPWLLMNGGDHLLPPRLADRQDALTASPVPVRSARLGEVFDAVRAADAASLPVVEGELRHLGDRLTFLLGGTLSTRTYLKQANARAQSALSDRAERLVARSAHPDATALLQHAWDLVVQNSPHDSVCGCSVDAVHRENAVRAERVEQLVAHLELRALQRLGLETRRVGPPPTATTALVVLNPHAHPLTGGVVADLVTTGAAPVALTAADGTAVPVEVEDLGEGPGFEADIDRLPDTTTVRRWRLAFLARDVPGHGQSLYEVALGAGSSNADAPGDWRAGRTFRTWEGSVTVDDDASLTVTGADGRTRPGLARLVDGGDRGDSYTWDPPVSDELVSPVVERCEVTEGPIRSRARVHAVLQLPVGLSDDRDARSESRRAVPLVIEATSWQGVHGLTWSVELDNTVTDHRLRLHAPAGGPAEGWLGDAAWCLLERPLGPVVGEMPPEPGLEAEIGTVPVQGLAAVGDGPDRTALLCPGLPEAQGLAATADSLPEVAVTLLRGVGWLSRFDLRTRTTGAGPQLATPGAQCPGPQRFELGLVWGQPVADDLELARRAAEQRAPLRAVQLFTADGDCAARAVDLSGAAPGVEVHGALTTAWKPAEDGDGTVLRVVNPTAAARTAAVQVGPGIRTLRSDLDEQRGEALPHDGTLALHLPPYGVTTLRLLAAEPAPAGSGA
jgi:alpha-mannosidase/mannosylglycerate hydrolase